MENQIKEQMEKAFWDLLEEETSVPRDNYPRAQALLEEIISILCSLVPNRKVTHDLIKKDLCGISWDLQRKLLGWIEKFQAPVHDKTTQDLSKKNLTISELLKIYYAHLELVHKEVFESRKRLANGENLFQPEKPESMNGVPINIKTGK